MKFRTLRADEIECRVSTVSAKGCSLLLYKDARADMILLDETVGAENWQRSHELINGNLFCNVSIKIDGTWVTKQDVGTESYTEKEKGQASDSFKRACVNWGIGRELYTAPFVWIESGDAKVQEKNGKWTTYEKFQVKSIEYDDARNIVSLVICNSKGLEVYSFGSKRKSASKAVVEPQKEEQKKQNDALEEANAKAKVLAYINKCNMSKENIEALCKLYKVEKVSELTLQHCNHYINFLAKKGINIDE